jgi:hypothetical protein
LFLFSGKILVPINCSFLKIFLKLYVALVAVLFEVIVHEGIILPGQLELMKCLLDHFFVQNNELLSLYGVVYLEDEKTFEHLSGAYFVVFLGQDWRDEGLIVRSYRDDIRVLMHIGRLILFGFL